MRRAPSAVPAPSRRRARTGLARIAAAPIVALLLVSCADTLESVSDGATTTPATSPAPTSAPTTASPEPTDAETEAAGEATDRVVPAELDVEVINDIFEHAWDVGFLPDGGALVSERPGLITHLSSIEPGAEHTPVEAPLEGVMARGEGGLMGLVVHPDFDQTREFTVCLNYQEGGQPVDVRLVTFALSEDNASAEHVRDLLTGIPTGTGRHSGCRPTVAADGALIVGTGDTADPAAPQDLSSLAGKTLRLDLKTGEPMPDNPFIDEDGPARYVLSYGHRNVQGVAIQPGTGEIYTAEHGPRVDDEVNRVEWGANYGWDPSRGGSSVTYDETVPMTDLDAFPDAVPAIWSTGDFTEALAGAVFLEGSQWGAWDGALAVAALKGEKMIVLTLDDEGEMTEVFYPAELEEHGRLRAARLGPNGALYLTTDNGPRDLLLKVTPKP